MKNFLLLLTLSVSLFAQNPKSYAALGDVIYDDAVKFEKLKVLPSMQEFTTAIESYIASVAQTKKMGFVIDKNDPETVTVEAEAYLAELRKLSIEHDAIVDSSRKRFTEAMNDEDSETVNAMISIGVIEPDDYKTELMHYYGEFGEDHNLSTLDKMYASHLGKQKGDTKATKVSGTTGAKSAAAAPKVKTKVNQKDEEIKKRMRAQDKAKTEALERAVEEEKQEEKAKILEKQKKELGIK
ncbi:MAG: hypothetical protein ABFR02_04930 [Campylobacterota bacterium]